MSIECFDLRPWARSHRYRWRWEESRQAGEDDPFFVQVVCKYGLIYPKGGNILLAYASSGVKRRLMRMGLEHHQWDDGSSEVFRFPVSKLDEIAAVLKPRKNRPGRTAEQMKALREGLRPLVQST